MVNRKQDACDTDALEGMVRNVQLFLTGAQTQLQQLRRALKDPQVIESRRERIKAAFMEKITGALEELGKLEADKSPDHD